MNANSQKQRCLALRYLNRSDISSGSMPWFVINVMNYTINFFLILVSFQVHWQFITELSHTSQGFWCTAEPAEV